MASLSYEPATDLEMYPGTTPMKRAARRPADGVENSEVKAYVATAVRPENSGAKKTQTSRI